MKEIFRPIAGYGDAYSVSNKGTVMRTSRRKPWKECPDDKKSRAKPFIPSVCKSFINRCGYHQVRIGTTGNQKTVCVHRLVAGAFCHNPNGFNDVNHIDGNKANNNSCNLEWISRSGNVIHAISLGLQIVRRGETHGNSKLTDKSVKDIRSSIDTTKLLAKKYGVSISLIQYVRQRKIWKHIT